MILASNFVLNYFINLGLCLSEHRITDMTSLSLIPLVSKLKWTLEINTKAYKVTRTARADRVPCPCILDGKQCSYTFAFKTRKTTRDHILQHFSAAGSSLGTVYYEEWLREDKTVIFLFKLASPAIKSS